MNSDATKVLSLLEELESLIDGSSGIPLSDKVVVSSTEVKDIIKEIRISLPEDMQQASWIKDNAEKIANEAKLEYERLVKEGKEQAEYLTDDHEITRKAKQAAHKIINDADRESRLLLLQACDASDKVLYDLLSEVNDINVKFFEQMLTEIEEKLTGINDKIAYNRNKLKEYATKVQNDEPLDEK